jgi:hypothetical protein
MSYEILKRGVDALAISEGKEDNFANLFLKICLNMDIIIGYVQRTNQTDYFLSLCDFRDSILMMSDPYLNNRGKGLDDTTRKLAAIISKYDMLSKFKEKRNDIIKIKKNDPENIKEEKEKLAQNLDKFFNFVDRIKNAYEQNKKNTNL